VANRTNRNVKLSIKRRLWNEPCAVCGLAGEIHVDHITPVSKGGTNDEGNLQALCWQCNYKKGNRLTNEQLRKWVESRWDQHVAYHTYHLATRYMNYYDRPGFPQWMRAKGRSNA
jgi:5-methylcytosine-specific restriction endonuclease McrA